MTMERHAVTFSMRQLLFATGPTVSNVLTLLMQGDRPAF